MQPGKAAVFLDRDGTINVDTGAVHTVSDWQFIEGAIEGLQRLQHGGFELAIVTNQAAIGNGRNTLNNLNGLHHHMRQELERCGVSIGSVVFCPHRRDENCACRKPKTGLFDQAQAEMGPVDTSRSWVIGDKESDVEFGKRAGLKSALIRSRYWEPGSLRIVPDLVVDSLREFSFKIVH